MISLAPVVWKRALRLNASKDGSRQRASELFPKHAGLWSLKKHDGQRQSCAAGALWAYALSGPAMNQPAGFSLLRAECFALNALVRPSIKMCFQTNSNDKFTSIP